MAKQVSEILVKLGIQGVEGLDKLKSSFRALNNSLGPSEDSLQKIRQEIINYTRDGGESIQVIKGQIEALKGLQAQATINGSAFKSLSKDVKDYEAKLRSAEAQIDSFNTKIKSQAAVESQFEKLGVSGLQNQLAKRRDLLGQATPLTEAYANALGGVIQFETVLTRLYERQAVIAAQAQTVKFTPSRGGAGEFGVEELLAYANVFQQLPNTSAAYSQRLKELRQDLSNLDIGSEKYIGTLREMIRLQKEMSRAERIAQVEGQDFALIGRQNRLEEAILAGRGRRGRLAGVIGESAATYQADAAAFRAALQPPPQQVREISSLYQQIGDIGMSKIAANIEMMGNSYETVTRDIKAATAASNNSISSLRNQRSAWASLKDTLDPTSRAYKEVGRELDLIDKKLQKTERGGRLSGRGMVQAAGAAVSGGIFGGIEGFVGGAIGGVVGGVPGAFAGAALGAQVSMIRQQAAVIAEYSAQLNLAKTTLAQASTGQADYNRLLASARQISSDYVVGLKSTIQGYAQVASAARANNLSFKETETIYRGVIAAGVAFGKSQQDLDAIVTATVQVLSKGKLSAEELQGQIGERLPGAVAKFAEATNRTLPQLAKDLEDGKVSIKDFVDYTKAQVQDYDQIARIIGESPEKAGARLQLALETAGENYGSFFLQIGSGFQDQMTQIVSWVNTNQGQIKRLIATVLLAGKDIIDIVKKTADALAPVLKPVFEFIFTNLARGISAIRKLIQDSKNLAEAEKNAQKQVELLYPNPIERALKGAPAFKEALAVEMKYLSSDPRSYTQRADDLAKQLFSEYKPSAYGALSAPSQSTQTQTSKDPAAQKAAEKAAREQQSQFDDTVRNAMRLEDLSLRKLAIEEATTIERQRQELIRANADDIELEILALKQERLGIDTKQSGVSEQINKLEDLRAQGLARGLDVTKILEEKDKLRLEYRQLELEGLQNETKEMQMQLRILESMGLTREMMRAGRVGAIGVFEQGRGGANGFNVPQVYEPTEGLTAPAQVYADMKKNLEQLLEVQNQVSTAANAIGESFANAFTQIVSDATSAREGLAEMMRSIAKSFLRMAQQIIAQQLAMIIYGTIMRALGIPTSPFGMQGAPNFSNIFGGGKAGFNAEAFTSMPRLNANGNVYAQNGIQPFAMGGIVNKPTLFKYADGGAGRFGLMGEAGPEAIMPLKRGRDGKLGVAGGGTTNVTVNVDAQGTQAQGDNNRGQQLGRAVAAAVQAELVKQKRPGGLLA